MVLRGKGMLSLSCRATYNDVDTEIFVGLRWVMGSVPALIRPCALPVGNMTVSLSCDSDATTSTSAFMILTGTPVCLIRAYT